MNDIRCTKYVNVKVNSENFYNTLKRISNWPLYKM